MKMIHVIVFGIPLSLASLMLVVWLVKLVWTA